jgi:hypothetical protein
MESASEIVNLGFNGYDLLNGKNLVEWADSPRSRTTKRHLGFFQSI